MYNEAPCFCAHNTPRARGLCPIHWLWPWVRAHRRSGEFLFQKINVNNVNRFIRKSLSALNVPAALRYISHGFRMGRRKSSRNPAPNCRLWRKWESGMGSLFTPTSTYPTNWLRAWQNSSSNRIPSIPMMKRMAGGRYSDGFGAFPSHVFRMTRQFHFVRSMGFSGFR